MAHEAVIVGAGQIAREAAHSLLFQNFSQVRVLARTRPLWLEQESETEESAIRFERYLVEENPAPCAEVILDTIAYDAQDVERYDPGAVGHYIAISSASVYCDDEGRTLDEASRNGWPAFSEPVTEGQRTVAPGPETYSTRKVQMENAARRRFGDRATILRPGAIYGEHNRHPREWWFVKRLMDRRCRIPLIFGGESQFQTTNSVDLAYFAARCADKQVGGTFNIGDSDHLSVTQIGKAIASEFDFEPEFVPVDGPGMVGRTPWSVAKPFLISSEAIGSALGYDMSGFTYTREAASAIDWLRDLNPADWRAAFPQLAAYPWDLFDYEAEDRFLASL